MKTSRWLMTCMVMALAVVMLWAAPTLAQGRGKGQWGQGGQGWGCGQGQGQGQGAGYANCPNYQGYQNCQGNWGNNPQANTGRRGPRGGSRAYQSNSQPTVPPPSQ
jgi:hypothetical protein